MLVNSEHLVITLKVITYVEVIRLIYIATCERLVISIFGYCNLSIPLLVGLSLLCQHNYEHNL